MCWQSDAKIYKYRPINFINTRLLILSASRPNLFKCHWFEINLRDEPNVSIGYPTNKLFGTNIFYLIVITVLLLWINALCLWMNRYKSSQLKFQKPFKKLLKYAHWVCTYDKRIFCQFFQTDRLFGYGFGRFGRVQFIVYLVSYVIECSR